MKRINVVISSDNKNAVTDWNAREWYLSLNHGDTAFIATSIMLNELRLGVRLKEIEPFSFDFNGEKLTCGEKGQLNNWPIGFMDQQGIQIKALMKGITYDDSLISMTAMRKKIT